MPRYRFRWEHLDEALLASLLPGALDHEQRAATLRARVGARPNAAFVADRWLVLRDDWLARADEPRRRVVDQLRARRIGDLAIDVSGPPGQLDYLRSCRNATTLRTVVLGELIRAGEAAPATHKTPPVPLDWPAFEAALATTLAGMTADQYLVVSVRGTGVGESDEGGTGTPYFVQFAVGGPEGLHAEAVSNHFLAGDERLGDEALAALLALGWLAPTRAPEPTAETPSGTERETGRETGRETETEGSPNHFRDWAVPVPVAEVATLAVRTLREVFHVSRPGFLQYEAFDGEGRHLELPTLPVSSRPSAGGMPALDLSGDDRLFRPTNPDELRAAVLATLRAALSNDDLEPDEDGDVGLAVGSVVIFVRALPDAPVVRLFSFVLTDVRWSPSLLVALNELNRDHTFVNAFFTDDQVILTSDLFAAPFVPEHLLGALRRFAAVADEYDDELLARFGGRVASGATARPPDDRAGYL